MITIKPNDEGTGWVIYYPDTDETWHGYATASAALRAAAFMEDAD